MDKQLKRVSKEMNAFTFLLPQHEAKSTYAKSKMTWITNRNEGNKFT